MLVYFSLIEGFFLYSREYSSFLSIFDSSPILVKEYSESVDFRMIRAVKPHHYITIEDPIREISLEQKNDGDLMLGNKTQRTPNQAYRLILLPTGSFSLMNSEKCIKYKENIKEFVREECNGEIISFDIYYEVSTYKDNLNYIDNLFHRKMKMIPTFDSYAHEKEIDEYIYNSTQSGFRAKDSRRAISYYNSLSKKDN